MLHHPSTDRLPPVQLDPEAHIRQWEKETQDKIDRGEIGAGGFVELPPTIDPSQVRLRPRQHELEKKIAFDCGATMSAVDERFDLICPAGLRRLASRYALGAEKHGDINWCLAGEDPKFQRARLNHLIKHVVAYLRNGNADDDNLAAIAWGAFALMHYEENCRHHETPLPKVPLTGEKFPR